MNRELFVSESGANAFNISDVKRVSIQRKTHVVEFRNGGECYISASDARRLRDLQKKLQQEAFFLPHSLYQHENGCFDCYYITGLRKVADGWEVTFDISSGMKSPLVLSEKDGDDLYEGIREMFGQDA